DAQEQVKQTTRELTAEERRQREKLISAYEYRSAEIVERADGEAELVVLRDDSKNAADMGIERNSNAQVVAEKERLARESSRMAHQKKVEREKELLEADRLRKEKEKRRTMKKEKRRILTGKAQALFEGITRGDRMSLARAITLVESSRADHRKQAGALVSACSRVQRPKTLRIGLTGTPGVGKSTFIESLGMLLLRKGHRVSVLAVDPSSARSGGSILGDKTRMQDLSVAEGAFVRPSPSRGSLGGVARNTMDSIILAEAAGFDVCLVETVGVGQSETMVADVVDMFILLLQPGSGDELQGVKRGIMELADLVVINKADGALELPAKLTRSEINNALHLMVPRRTAWAPKCLRASAVTGYNLERVWDTVL
ncbi:hypothetical protein LPJ73_007619, partial [Coemansia sp. RSA 2703]